MLYVQLRTAQFIPVIFNNIVFSFTYFSTEFCYLTWRNIFNTGEAKNSFSALPTDVLPIIQNTLGRSKTMWIEVARFGCKIYPIHHTDLSYYD